MKFRAKKNDRTGKWKTSKTNGQTVFINSGIDHNPPPSTERGHRRNIKKGKPQ